MAHDIHYWTIRKRRRDGLDFTLHAWLGEEAPPLHKFLLRAIIDDSEGRRHVVGKLGNFDASIENVISRLYWIYNRGGGKETTTFTFIEIIQPEGTNDND